MNTIDATPQHSFGVRVTLFRQRYPFVNLPVRTTTQALKKPPQCDLWLTGS
jgi:hypothetical protein